MKLSYLVIADDDTVLGFQCAGIPGVAVSTAEETVQALQEAKERNVGIVILTEEVAASIQAELDELRFGDALPLVVEIPGAQGPMPGRRGLTEIIREAIGIKV